MTEVINQEKSQGQYILHIENFDGPLDLLWDLIKKSKIDIIDISLSDITEQYCSYLKVMKGLNVRIASEFIWMASELLYYKSRALLPTDDLEDEYFTPPLPPELIEKLLEYKRYQQTAGKLREFFDIQDRHFTRENNLEEMIGREEYVDVSLFDLLKAFAEVIESTSTVEQEEIVFDEILVSDRIDYITGMLKEKEYIVFSEIFTKKPGRSEIVATFLAILEMARTRMIRLMQHRQFGDIRLVRKFNVEDIPKDHDTIEENVEDTTKENDS